MENKDKHLLHSINKPRVATSLTTPIVIVIIIVALALGAATGFGIYRFSSGSSTTTANSSNNTAEDGSKTSAGILDEKTFPDQAEGTLQEGGFEGEGSFNLQRPGGDDQTVYLTSSTVDLSEFVGKEVSVRGQTFRSEKAGWLMDVGYIEVTK